MVSLYGLVNDDNTCYINCILQCLLNIPPLRKLIFVSGDKSNKLHHAFRTLIACYHKNTNISKQVKPKTFLKNVFDNFYFTEGEQHDAHEFLCCLLSYLEDTCNININSILSGKWKTTLKCSCGYKSVNKMVYSGLTIVPDQTIQDGIINSMKETVESKCEKCEKNSRKTMEKTVVKHSKYLFVHVARFNSNGTKNNQQIEYTNPIGFDYKTYEPIACVYHMGSLNNGHYLSSVLFNDEWYMVNDEFISKSSIDKAYLKQNVYMVLYKRNC
jgi:ubiquitin C-terminal hydrolase